MPRESRVVPRKEISPDTRSVVVKTTNAINNGNYNSRQSRQRIEIAQLRKNCCNIKGSSGMNRFQLLHSICNMCWVSLPWYLEVGTSHLGLFRNPYHDNSKKLGFQLCQQYELLIQAPHGALTTSGDPEESHNNLAPIPTRESRLRSESPQSTCKSRQILPARRRRAPYLAMRLIRPMIKANNISGHPYHSYVGGFGNVT
ncbi:hypothetical protein K449DRAFT_402383 [Hypoxylon sp. EC38]|nr:hypothetical protein K449DRAFT_402383 [Hypoxylon sp. EC38]